jgi:hypothetical protein
MLHLVLPQHLSSETDASTAATDVNDALNEMAIPKLPRGE